MSLEKHVGAQFGPFNKYALLTSSNHPSIGICFAGLVYLCSRLLGMYQLNGL